MTTTTETKVEVSPAVLAAVKDFVKTQIKTNEIIAKAKASAESKYWPMVEQALVLFEQKMDRTDIAAQFREACKIVHGDAETMSRHTSTWRLMAANVTKIAFQGREWVEEQKSLGLGFWATLDLINHPEKAVDSDEAETDPEATKAKPKRGTKPPKASKSKAKSTHKRSGNVKVRGGGGDSDSEDPSEAPDLDQIMEAIEEKPKLFKQIVEKVLENAMVDIEDLEAVQDLIGQHLSDKK